MDLGNKLLELRKKKGLSQEEVADAIGVSRQTVSKWETGLSQPELERIKPLSELFEVSVEEIVTGKSVEEAQIDLTVGKDRKKSAVLLIISIFIYFLSVIAIIVLEEFGAPDSISVGSFLLLVGIATCMNIYRAIVYNTVKREQERHEEKKVKNVKLRLIQKILAIVTLIIYLLISFLTSSWHITWIIWIIFAVLVEIIKLIFLMKGEEIDE